MIFTIENVPKNKKTDFYETINNMSYRDYVEKYLGINNWTEEGKQIMNDKASLFALSDYLKNNNNYKIYESLDDYYVNKDQIAKLKDIVDSKLICFNCGSHLGFLYRKEFEKALKNEFNFQEK